MSMILSSFFSDPVDIPLIQWIHQDLHNRVLDFIMPYLRMKTFWIPLYLVLIFYLYKWYKKYFWLPILFLAATAGLTDFSNSSLIKNEVARLRPCNDERVKDTLEVLVPCGGGYSFMSSHASNHMAIAVFMFLLLLYRKNKWRYVWILWALIIGFAQIYVGVHYPTDVLLGFIYGGLIGWGMYVFFEKAQKKLTTSTT